MKINKNFSVVILSAGNSSRMNFPKAFLPFDDKRNFADKIIKAYVDAGITNVILVVNEDLGKIISTANFEKFKPVIINVVVNRCPEKGRFYSIRCGLEHAKNRFIFLQNIDNPFITKELPEKMMEVVVPGAYVCPEFNGKPGHPVLLSSSIRSHILSREGYDYNLRDELKKFIKITLNSADEKILVNINTTAEYEQHFSAMNMFVKKATGVL